MGAVTKNRWAFLLSALAATVIAIAYPVKEEGELVEVAASVSRPAPAAKTESLRSDVWQLEWIASDEDPFAAKGWQVPPPASEPAKQTLAAPVVTPEAPPPPSPLPYKFVGQMNDGAQRVVYLSRGEQVLLAHQGDLLDGSYKVLAIGSAQIEFEAVSSGFRQTLPIPVQD